MFKKEETLLWRKASIWQVIISQGKKQKHSTRKSSRGKAIQIRLDNTPKYITVLLLLSKASILMVLM
jgi:hypothetical protein